MSIINRWDAFRTFSPPAQHYLPPIVTALRIEPVNQTPPSPANIWVSSEAPMTNDQPKEVQMSDRGITQGEVAQLNSDEQLPNDDNIDPSLVIQALQNLLPKVPKKTVYCSVCQRGYTGYQQHLRTLKHMKNQKSAAQHVQV